MREIPLTRGKVAIVDDDDYERVAAFRWHARPCMGKWYAARRAHRRLGETGEHVYMHRFITEAQPETDVDHWSGDGLDNRRTNLRVCSHAANIRNSDRTTFGGVTRCPQTGRWLARYGLDGVRRHVGRFDTYEEARRVLDEVKRRLGVIQDRTTFRITSNGSAQRNRSKKTG